MPEDNWEKSRRIERTWAAAQSAGYAEDRGNRAEHYGETSEALREYRLAVSEYRYYRGRFPGIFDERIGYLEQKIKEIEQKGLPIADAHRREVIEDRMNRARVSLGLKPYRY